MTIESDRVWEHDTCVCGHPITKRMNAVKWMHSDNVSDLYYCADNSTPRPADSNVATTNKEMQ